VPVSLLGLNLFLRVFSEKSTVLLLLKLSYLLLYMLVLVIHSACHYHLLFNKLTLVLLHLLNELPICLDLLIELVIQSVIALSL